MKACLRYFSFVIVIMLTGCLFEDPTPPPSDDEMIKIFNDNKEIFNQLVKTICKDGYLIISYDPKWTKPEEIPLDKKEWYYDLLEKISADQIQRLGADVNISVWSIGLGGDGNSKGYTYRPDSYDEQVDSLDNFTSKGMPEFLVHDIGKGWYLYYEHCP